jgi:hypothetical protein
MNVNSTDEGLTEEIGSSAPHPVDVQGLSGQKDLGPAPHAKAPAVPAPQPPTDAR